MRRGSQSNHHLKSVVTHLGEAAPLTGKLTKQGQMRLLRELGRVLEELDASGLALAAIHIDSAICEIKDAEIQQV